MDAQWLLFGAVAFAGLLHGVSGMGFALITIAAISWHVQLIRCDHPCTDSNSNLKSISMAHRWAWHRP